jgi:predicted kinase
MTSKLVLICGVPGSGKTYIGKQICQNLRNSVFADKDTLSRYFTEAMLELLGSNKNDRESEIYLNRVRSLEYDTLMKHAFENLQIGRTVVCSAPFGKELSDPAWISSMELETDLIDAELILIWIHADEHTARDRIIARGAERDIGKLAAWTEYVSKVSHSVPAGIAGLVVIDNSAQASLPLAVQMKAVIESISEGNP